MTVGELCQSLGMHASRGHVPYDTRQLCQTARQAILTLAQNNATLTDALMAKAEPPPLEPTEDSPWAV